MTHLKCGAIMNFKHKITHGVGNSVSIRKNQIARNLIRTAPKKGSEIRQMPFLKMFYKSSPKFAALAALVLLNTSCTSIRRPSCYPETHVAICRCGQTKKIIKSILSLNPNPYFHHNTNLYSTQLWSIAKHQLICLTPPVYTNNLSNGMIFC